MSGDGLPLGLLVLIFVFQNQKNNKINQFNCSILHSTLKSSAVCAAYCLLCCSAICSHWSGHSLNVSWAVYKLSIRQPVTQQTCTDLRSALMHFYQHVFFLYQSIWPGVFLHVFPPFIFIFLAVSLSASPFSCPQRNVCINLSKCHIAVFMLAFLFYTMFSCQS